MKQDNIGHLKDQVLFTGFGKALHSVIDENTKNGVAEFTGKYNPDFGPNAETTAYFAQSKQGNYFFNKFDLEIEKGTADAFKNTFFVNPPVKGVLAGDGTPEERWVNSNITLKEAWNLAMGRSVLKEHVTHETGEIYRAWSKMNFNEVDKYGNYEIVKLSDYNLLGKLMEFKIKDLVDSTATANLLRSLERGNLVPVELEAKGNASRYYVEANPHYKTINIYDSNFVRQKHADLKEEQPNQSVAESKGKEAGQGKSEGKKEKEGEKTGKEKRANKA